MIWKLEKILSLDIDRDEVGRSNVGAVGGTRPGSGYLFFLNQIKFRRHVSSVKMTQMDLASHAKRQDCPRNNAETEHDLGVNLHNHMAARKLLLTGCFQSHCLYWPNIDRLTDAPTGIGLSPLREQFPPAMDFAFLPSPDHEPPASLSTYTNRDLAIDSLAASYPTIRRERIIEIVDEAIGELENILHNNFDM